MTWYSMDTYASVAKELGQPAQLPGVVRVIQDQNSFEEKEDSE